MFMDICAKIKTLRKKSGMTMVEVANKSGIPQSAISLIERGKKPNVSVAVVEKILNAMGYRIDVVLDV